VVNAQERPLLKVNILTVDAMENCFAVGRSREPHRRYAAQGRSVGPFVALSSGVPAVGRKRCRCLKQTLRSTPGNSRTIKIVKALWWQSQLASRRQANAKTGAPHSAPASISIICTPRPNSIRRERENVEPTVARHTPPVVRLSLNERSGSRAK